MYSFSRIFPESTLLKVSKFLQKSYLANYQTASIIHHWFRITFLHSFRKILDYRKSASGKYIGEYYRIIGQVSLTFCWRNKDLCPLHLDLQNASRNIEKQSWRLKIENKSNRRFPRRRIRRVEQLQRYNAYNDIEELKITS